MLISATLGILCASLTGPLIIGGALFWTTFNGRLTPEDAFTTLGFAMLLNEPLNKLVMGYPNLTSGLACVGRIQEFLALEANHQTAPEAANDADRGSDVADFDEKGQALQVVEEKAKSLPTEASNIFELADASLAIQGTDKKVLHDINVSIKRYSVFMVVGPTGCGKSTLLKSVIEESHIASGARYVEQGPKAFCDQSPWIQNKSIRDNIIAYSPFEEGWYDKVVDACQLKKDFSLLAGGDRKLAGSNGVKLSGGQKHRIVSTK